MQTTILRRSAVLGSLLLCLVLVPEVPGQGAEGLTPWQVATLRSVGAAEISPDGGHVAYVVGVQREPGVEDDGTQRSELHVLEVASGASRPYVTAESGVGRVAWTPDGQAITFVARREGDEHGALWSIPLGGGEARRLFGLDDRGIGAYELAADGRRLAYLATPPLPEEQRKAEKQGFRAIVYEEALRSTEAFVVELGQEQGEPRRLELEGHVSDLAWSPDGRHLALAVAPTALVDDGYTSKRVWIVDAADGSVTGRIENRGKLDGFEWRPDGSGLALIAALDEHDGSAARLLWGAVGASTRPAPVLGERLRDENDVHWLDADHLLVLGSEGVWSNLDTYRFEDGAAVEREPLVPLEGPVFSSLSVSADGRRAALVGATPEHPPELFLLDLETSELRRASDLNPWLAEVALAPQEVVRYAARDGLEVEGLLIRPLDGRVPAPLIVVVHGGPEAHLSNGWLTRYSDPGQVGAARGYAVFYPNYRGSTGRGLAYLKSSQGDPAGREFDDIVDGVDHLIAAGVADAERVGVTGGSYGGYATGWCSTYYSDRFAAGVMFVGISNKISKVGTTDIPDEEFLVHAMKRPWDDWQMFLERSPIYHADRGRTPLLILHGLEDTRVDPGQSRELYRHLKLRGKAPVRLVNYPGEGHGNRKAAARFDYNLRMLRWFDHYLKGAGGEPPAWPLDPAAHRPAGEEEAGEDSDG